MKIIVYEHVSGGGYAGQQIQPEVLAEGYGMLRTLTADFQAAGHEVTVLLDARLSKLNSPINADCTIPVFYPEETKRFLLHLASVNDAIFIIAPETNQTLQSLVLLIEPAGKILLNCQSSAIQGVADKTVLYEKLKKNDINVPKSLFFNINEGLTAITQAVKVKFCYPVVFKPTDGVSCNGLSLVNDEEQVKRAVEKIKAQSTAKQFIVQEYINGKAASVSLLVANGKALPISLNKQNVNLALPAQNSSYLGGFVPYNHPFKHEAFSVAQKAVECFEGLRGHVGVDVILTKDKQFVVDVNPRLTTSYVGLSQTANFNVAQAIINAVLESELPAKLELDGYICFSKIETPKPSLGAFKKACQMIDVVSPPFPLADNTKATSLVVCKGKSLEEADLRLEEAKKRLLNIVNRGK